MKEHQLESKRERMKLIAREKHVKKRKEKKKARERVKKRIKCMCASEVKGDKAMTLYVWRQSNAHTQGVCVGVWQHLPSLLLISLVSHLKSSLFPLTLTSLVGSFQTKVKAQTSTNTNKDALSEGEDAHTVQNTSLINLSVLFFASLFILCLFLKL